jgi:predicted Rossmann fold nucleotide-binding protein DprA/Smf involved in DNA uptake
MNIAIIGSRTYENTRKIKTLLIDLRKRFGDELTIISGGCMDGADKHIKKYSIEFGINYKEYNLAHTPKNLYSAMSEHYYGKPYHVSQFHHRNNLIAKNCDMMIALIPDSDTTKGSASAVKCAQKHKKKVVILT